MKKEKLSQTDLKFLAKPFGFFALSLVVLISVLSFGIKQIRQTNDKLGDAKKLKSILTQNVNTLSSVDEEIAEQQSFIEVVLPESNSQLFFISQARKMAYEKQVFITNIKTGMSTEADNGLSKASVSFDLEGPVDSISDYIDEIKMTLPLISVEKVETTMANDLARSSITVNVYSAELPKKIPSLTSAVASFTAEEKELLVGLLDYTLPTFLKPEPTEPTQRDNPFQ
jgi:hypothetical protein